jgi:hypothetical protein
MITGGHSFSRRFLAPLPKISALAKVEEDRVESTRAESGEGKLCSDRNNILRILRISVSLVRSLIVLDDNICVFSTTSLFKDKRRDDDWGVAVEVGHKCARAVLLSFPKINACVCRSIVKSAYAL